MAENADLKKSWKYCTERGFDSWYGPNRQWERFGLGGGGHRAVCELPFYEICRSNVSRIECAEMGCCFHKQTCYKKVVPQYMKAFLGLIVLIMVLFVLFLLYCCCIDKTDTSLTKKPKKEEESESDTSSSSSKSEEED